MSLRAWAMCAALLERAILQAQMVGLFVLALLMLIIRLSLHRAHVYVPV